MPEPIDESAAVVAWLRAEVAEWLPLNPHTDLGLSARSGAALLARLDAAEAERDRLRALLAEARPYIGRCGVLADDSPCYRWDDTSDLEDRIDAALAPAE